MLINEYIKCIRSVCTSNSSIFDSRVVVNELRDIMVSYVITNKAVVKNFVKLQLDISRYSTKQSIIKGAHPLTHPLIHSLIHSLTHSLTHSLLLNERFQHKFHIISSILNTIFSKCDEEKQANIEGEKSKTQSNVDEKANQSNICDDDDDEKEEKKKEKKKKNELFTWIEPDCYKTVGGETNFTA